MLSELFPFSFPWLGVECSICLYPSTGLDSNNNNEEEDNNEKKKSNNNKNEQEEGGK